MAAPIIRSSTDIRRDYNGIEALAKETGQPIYLTKNGRASLVVIDAATKSPARWSIRSTRPSSTTSATPARTRRRRPRRRSASALQRKWPTMTYEVVL